MTISLTFWTFLAVFFGAGILFFFGMYLGFKIAMKSVDMFMDDMIEKKYLEFGGIRFIPVVKGGRK